LRGNGSAASRLAAGVVIGVVGVGGTAAAQDVATFYTGP
jgi:hypothetical protein